MEKIKHRNKHHDDDAVHNRSSSSSSSSPRLMRSRSASPAIINISSADYRVPIFGVNSKTTAPKAKLKSSRRVNDEQIKLNSIYNNNNQKKVARDDNSHDRVLPQSKIQQPRKARSASSSPSPSPSAWALSPGRLLHPLPPVQVVSTSTTNETVTILKKRSKGKGVGGVLKYFRQKKISHLQEEEYHQFRIMHNRLLQWRFANARAEVSMATAKRNAEKKLFNAWAKITMLRKLVVENRIKIQRLKQEIKLHQIVSLQMHLLKEWGGRLENKNSEAVGRLARKLTAISICLPLQDAKVDTESLHHTMCIAMRIIESIEETITPIQSQAEKLCYLLTELSIITKEEADNVNNLAELLGKIACLEQATEESLKVQLVQLEYRSKQLSRDLNGVKVTNC